MDGITLGRSQIEKEEDKNKELMVTRKTSHRLIAPVQKLVMNSSNIMWWIFLVVNNGWKVILLLKEKERRCLEMARDWKDGWTRAES